MFVECWLHFNINKSELPLYDCTRPPFYCYISFAPPPSPPPNMTLSILNVFVVILSLLFNSWRSSFRWSGRFLRRPTTCRCRPRGFGWGQRRPGCGWGRQRCRCRRWLASCPAGSPQYYGTQLRMLRPTWFKGEHPLKGQYNLGFKGFLVSSYHF